MGVGAGASFPLRRTQPDSSVGQEKVALSIGSHLARGSTGLLLRLPPSRPLPPGSSLRGAHRRGWGGGRGSQLTGSSISSYMLGASAFLKLFPDWEGAGRVGGTVLRRSEITQNIREQMVEEAWRLLKCGPCTKAVGN